MSDNPRITAHDLIAAADRAKTDRATAMPTERDALAAMTQAHHRLTELGWRSAMYAPKDSPLLLIEPGSSGIHSGRRDAYGFWILDGDMWPSSPCLFKLDSEAAR